MEAIENSNIVVAPFETLFSEEMQEAIGTPPNWITKWGTAMIVAVFVILISISTIVHYPDIISAPFTLTSIDAPRSIVIRTDGRLAKVLVKEGTLVKSGQILAYTESTADQSQIFQLEKDLQDLTQIANAYQWQDIAGFSLPEYSRLGELQTDFKTFNEILVSYNSFVSDGFFVKKGILLAKDLEHLKTMETVSEEQLRLREKDLELAIEEFRVQEILAKEKVISKIDLTKEKARLIGRELPVKELRSQLVQARSNQNSKQKEILELEKSFVENRNSFKQALFALQNSIQKWKQAYIIIAPIAGKASFSVPIQENQFMSFGEELLTIEPQGSRFQGVVRIDQNNLGKLEEGQNIQIKLSGYPYKEYGFIIGKLSKISITPSKDSTFWAFVELPDQLRTTYGLTLKYRSGMNGTADIVTRDRSLASRIITTFATGN